MTDALGGYSRSFMMVVNSYSQVDAILKNVYSGLLDNLNAVDISGALKSVNGTQHDKYLEIFTSLAPYMASIISNVGTLQTGTISGDIAEYSLLRDTASGNRAFLIYFLRGEDGVWRIEEM